MHIKETKYSPYQQNYHFVINSWNDFWLCHFLQVQKMLTLGNKGTQETRTDNLTTNSRGAKCPKHSDGFCIKGDTCFHKTDGTVAVCIWEHAYVTKRFEDWTYNWLELTKHFKVSYIGKTISGMSKEVLRELSRKLYWKFGKIGWLLHKIQRKLTFKGPQGRWSTLPSAKVS